MKLRFTPRAMNDLTAIRRFIRDEYGNPKAAKRITDSIFAQCTNLKQFPQSGTALSARFEIDTDVRYRIYDLLSHRGRVRVCRRCDPRENRLSGCPFPERTINRISA